MPRRRDRSGDVVHHALLSWRFVEDWFQEHVSGSPWICGNMACTARTADGGREPREASDGRYLCPECSEPLSYRCGNLSLPVGEVVPPDICQSRCRFYSCCIRYRLHDMWQRDLAAWVYGVPQEIESYASIEEFYHQDFWEDFDGLTEPPPVEAPAAAAARAATSADG